MPTLWLCNDALHFSKVIRSCSHTVKAAGRGMMCGGEQVPTEALAILLAVVRKHA